ncbi:uncharacterized protein LOC141908424 [Tubulanus polymorphus]|uniref:uncharacterized protein LOC141908424 n=1 Tax=Tubulanus polymorphus TaxID=672921 RepID=UPI003DA3925B
MPGRKLIFDHYNRSYHYESKIESIKRQCNARSNKVVALNKNEQQHLDVRKYHIKQEEKFYRQKSAGLAGHLRENMRDHIAYKNVLRGVAKHFAADPTNTGNLGRYGPNSTYYDVYPLIHAEIRDMSPEVRRRKFVRELLNKRKQLEVIDRTMTDSQIFGSSLRKDGDTADERRFVRQHSAQLILPPMKVSMRPLRTSSSSAAIAKPEERFTSAAIPDSERSDHIFLTQQEI